MKKIINFIEAALKIELDSFDKVDNSGELDKENALKLNNDSLNQSQIF